MECTKFCGTIKSYIIAQRVNVKFFMWDSVFHIDVTSKDFSKDFEALVLWMNCSEMSLVYTKMAMGPGSPWVLGGLKCNLLLFR